MADCLVGMSRTRLKKKLSTFTTGNAMTCPNCGKPRDAKALECESCGIIFARYDELRREEQKKAEEADRKAAEHAKLVEPRVFSETLRGVFSNKVFAFTAVLLVAGGLAGLYYMQPTRDTPDTATAFTAPVADDSQEYATKLDVFAIKKGMTPEQLSRLGDVEQISPSLLDTKKTKRFKVVPEHVNENETPLCVN